MTIEQDRASVDGLMEIVLRIGMAHFDEGYGDGRRNSGDRASAREVAILLEAKLRAYAERLAAEPAVPAQEWMPVTKRLPDAGQTVAVLLHPFNKPSNRPIVCGALYAEGGCFLADCDGDPLHPPTHWMPLPQPPKGRPT